MNKIFNWFCGIFATSSLLFACNNDNIDDIGSKEMSFNITYPSHSRATESGFETNDNIGLYMSAINAPLEIGGNFINNEKISFNGKTWSASRKLYWDDGKYNVYAYYPYCKEINSIEDYPFSVSTDQTTTKTTESLGGYEASDFLYASKKDIAASDGSVTLSFKHIMTKLTIRLIKGEDFEGDMPEHAEVYVHNTVPSATIDLNVGVATKSKYGKINSIRAKENGNFTYSAIIVPQRLSNRLPLIEVIMNNVSYMFESKFVFKPGMQQFINLVITESPEQAKIEIGGEIQDWE